MPDSRPCVRPLLAATVAALTLGGCDSLAPPAAPAPPPKSAADQRSATPAAQAALVTERQWLQKWFRDTPVQIRQAGDGTISIEVPRTHCFEPGGSGVKPALAAVLDKVAESLRRVPLARVPLLAAPDDAAGSAPLALQRALQVRQHLSARGVSPARLGPPTATAATAVQLRLQAAAQ